MQRILKRFKIQMRAEPVRQGNLPSPYHCETFSNKLPLLSLSAAESIHTPDFQDLVEFLKVGTDYSYCVRVSLSAHDCWSFDSLTHSTVVAAIQSSAREYMVNM